MNYQDRYMVYAIRGELPWDWDRGNIAANLHKVAHDSDSWWPGMGPGKSFDGHFLDTYDHFVDVHGQAARIIVVDHQERKIVLDTVGTMGKWHVIEQIIVCLGEIIAGASDGGAKEIYERLTDEMMERDHAKGGKP